MKLKLKGIDENAGAVNRLEIRHFLENKYFNLFMNKFHWEGLDREAIDYIMRRFWADGTVAGFPALGTVGTLDNPAGVPVFAPYTPQTWNTYDFPASVMLINKRGVPFIPDGELFVSEDVVLGFIQRNRKPVRAAITHLIEDVVEAEIAIAVNLDANKLPWTFTGPAEMHDYFENLFSQIKNGKSALYLSADTADQIKILSAGGQFLLDKLLNFRDARENQIREYLGINALGIGEKKEHLTVGEVDINNDTINQSGDVFEDCLKEFANEMNDVFGFDISVEINRPSDVDSKTTPEEEKEQNETY